MLDRLGSRDESLNPSLLRVFVAFAIVFIVEITSVLITAIFHSGGDLWPV